MKTSKPSHAGGRPPKFMEESRPVTVTLPESTLRQLSSIHPDRAQAIVKATEAVLGSTPGGMKPVELVEVSPGLSVIVVGPCKSLRHIPWLQLVEITPARNLLIIPSGTAVDSLEVAILDLLENLPVSEAYEQNLLKELRNELGCLRRGRKISKAEIIFFDTAKQ